jgi:hypothetical protein
MDGFVPQIPTTRTVPTGAYTPTRDREREQQKPFSMEDEPETEEEDFAPGPGRSESGLPVGKPLENETGSHLDVTG